jgi:spermidine/putrescine transport system ATP-binding protein
MNHRGAIEQIGTPKEIYEFPASSFVAKFVGTTNIMRGNLKNLKTDPCIVIPDLGEFVIDKHSVRSWMTEGKEAIISLRPEKIFLSKRPDARFSNTISGTVQSIVYHGRSTQYNISVGTGLRIQVFEQNEEHFPQEVIDYDNVVHLFWQKENAVILEK